MNSHKIKLFEQFSLSMLALCFFVSSISVTLTTITYLSAFLCLLFSWGWRERFLRIQQNKAAISFWVLSALFIIGMFYSTSTSHLAWHDLQKRHWLFMTPFFIMIMTSEVWRQRMLNTFLLAVVLTLIFSYLKWFHLVPYHWLPVKRLAGQRASVFFNYIVQSFAMSIAAFVCGYRALFEKKWHIVYAVLFALMAINIMFMSEGRVGYAIFLLLMVYLSFIRFSWKGLLSAVLCGVVVIGLAAAFSASFQDRMKVLYENYHHYGQSTQSTSVGQRLEMVSIAKNHD